MYGPILAPLGWSVFTVGKPDRKDLDLINNIVNNRITPVDADATKPWRIIEGDAEAKDGCCHDYACTKRAMLMARGWVTSQLLFRIVKYSATEYHMVLVAVDHGQEWVLDNLRPDVVLWSEAGYSAIMSQLPEDPSKWVGYTV